MKHFKLIFFTGSLIINLFCLEVAFATTANTLDDLEEAIPQLDLDKTTTDLPLPSVLPTPDKIELNFENRTRSYLLIEAEQKINKQVFANTSSTNSSSSNNSNSKTKVYFPNAEASLTTEIKKSETFIFFTDGIVSYADVTKNSQMFINQIGLRGQFAPQWQWAMGKERNRRSPAMFISPSDIIYSQLNLPGQREDRQGIWLTRISYQDTARSYDFYILPIDKESHEGLPQTTQGTASFAIRAFEQFNNLDVSLSVGKIHNINKAGLALQGLIMDYYKIYGEVGYQQYSSLGLAAKKNNPLQLILGLSYEGSDVFSAKLEYLYNGQGLTPNEYKTFLLPIMMPFLRQKYLLFNIMFPEIQKKYNIISTSIIGLEDNAHIQLLRGEYITTDHLLVGASMLELGGATGSQYYYRNFDRQFNLDVKYSF